MPLIRPLSALILACPMAMTPLRAQLLAPFQETVIDANYLDATWADFDRDGNLDIGFSYDKTPTYNLRTTPPRQVTPAVRKTQLLRFDPASSRFAVSQSYDIGGMRMAWGDCDGNSWPDLLTSSDTMGVRWLLNPGLSPTLRTSESGIPANTGTGDLRLADLNRSGWPDILTLGMGGGAWVYLKPSLQDQARIKPKSYLPFWTFGLVNLGAYSDRSSLAVGDLDNDGVLDVVESGNGDAQLQYLPVTRVFKGISPLLDTLHFNPKGDLAPLTSGSLTLFDLDGDGDLDILATGCTQTNGSGYATHLYRNDGNFVFTELGNTGLDGFGRSAADFADVNGDGRPDLLLTGTTASGLRTALYLNQAPGAATLFIEDSPGSIPGAESGAAHFGDFDHDGKPDLLLTGLRPDGKGFMAVYRNVRP
jgi:hypothetical protein